MTLRKIIIYLPLFILLSCATISHYFDTDDSYLIGPGKIEENKGLPQYKAKILFKKRKNETWFELTSPILYKAKIKGKISEVTKDSRELELNSFHLIANWPRGWTEIEMELSGKFTLSKNTDLDTYSYKATITEEFEYWEVQTGAIKYEDSYYRDRDGLRKVSNRVARVMAAVDFLREINGDEKKIYGHFWRKSSYGDAMFWDIKKMFFPETMIFKQIQDSNQLITGFTEQNNLKISDKFQWGNYMLWRKDYTEQCFPEHLKNVRNSGTLYRDFEETPGLFLTLYNMEYFFNNILSEIEFEVIE